MILSVEEPDKRADWEKKDSWERRNNSDPNWVLKDLEVEEKIKVFFAFLPLTPTESLFAY